MSASSGETPGSAALRSVGLTSLPRPPLEIEHEALDSLGELVEELHGDAAAKRVPDDRRAVYADRGEQVADAGGVGTERVVAARRGGVAVADQVGGDHGVVAG